MTFVVPCLVENIITGTSTTGTGTTVTTAMVMPTVIGITLVGDILHNPLCMDTTVVIIQQQLYQEPRHPIIHILTMLWFPIRAEILD